VPFEKTATWSLKMPSPIALLRPDMTDAEFAAEQKSVSDAILSISGTGSPTEQPLCTLGRYVTQDAASLPKNVVFLIISDEDDISTPAECLVGFTENVDVTKSEASTSPCASNCTTYRYSMVGDYPWMGRQLQCAAFDDTGKPIPGTEKPQSVSQMAASCTPGPCTTDESTDAARFCDQGLSLVSCQRTCFTSETRCTVDLPTAGINACTQSFTFGGATYANLPAYCAARGDGSGWRDCGGGGLNIEYSESMTGGFSPRPLVFGKTTSDIGAYFKSKADTAFGAGRYLVEAIVFDPAFSCSLGAGQSYATNLAAVVGDRSRLFPLCEPYAPALDGVLGFAQTLIQTTFPVPLKSDEHITFIHVVSKTGPERTLTDKEFSYDRTTGTLTIQRTSLRGTDSTLRVEVTSDCRPLH
jgi:hypothetical protein